MASPETTGIQNKSQAPCKTRQDIHAFNVGEGTSDKKRFWDTE